MRWLTPWLAVLALFVFGCSKPSPPVLTPKEATVVAASLVGLEVRVRVEAYNPNRIDLTARTVTARVVVDGRYDLGTVTVPRGLRLPAGARTDVDVPLSLRWTDVGILGSLAASGRPIPYAVSGTASVGSETFQIDVPFQVQGQMTPEQLVDAAARSLPSIPGLGQPSAPAR